MVQEPGSQNRIPTGITGEGPVPKHRLLPVSSHDRRGLGAQWGLLYKSTDPIYGASLVAQ